EFLGVPEPPAQRRRQGGTPPTESRRGCTAANTGFQGGGADGSLAITAAQHGRRVSLPAQSAIEPPPQRSSTASRLSTVARCGSTASPRRIPVPSMTIV